MSEAKPLAVEHHPDGYGDGNLPTQGKMAAKVLAVSRNDEPENRQDQGKNP